MQSQKLHFQGKPFNITVIQVYAPTSNAEEAEVERFYEDLQDLLEHPKKMSFFTLHPSTVFWTLVDHDGYSISSEEFVPAVVDIMVI